MVGIRVFSRNMASRRSFNFVNKYFIWHCGLMRSFNTNSLLPEKLKIEFENSLPKIIENAVNRSYFVNSPDAVLRMKKITEYITCTKTPVQGEIMLLAYEMHEQDKNMTEVSKYQANVLAWGLETLQTYFQVMDDIEDQGEIRNGKPCWHLCTDVIQAINDISMLRSFLQEMLRQNLDTKMYVNVLDIFNEIYTHITIGQQIDYEMSRTKKYDSFTESAYINMVRHKCTSFCVKFPIFLALQLCNRLDRHAYDVINKISEDIGAIIQIRNDFADCFIEDSITGNSGTDIGKGKFTWLSMSALQRGNAKQREEFTQCYGNFDTDKVKKIRQIYEELDLPELFHDEIRKRLQNFQTQINQLPLQVTPSLEFLRKLPELLNIKTP